MPKRQYSPEEITDKLVGFDPTDKEFPSPYADLKPGGVIETDDPKNFSLPIKETASEALKRFMDANNIVFTVSPPSEGIKTVSDGSVIFSAPKIVVAYKNN